MASRQNEEFRREEVRLALRAEILPRHLIGITDWLTAEVATHWIVSGLADELCRHAGRINPARAPQALRVAVTSARSDDQLDHALSVLASILGKDV